jgi:hypothetical protein
MLIFGGGSPVFAETQSASLYLSPYSGAFFVGNTFDVSVFVNTEENNINAVEVNLKFPPELLQVTSPTANFSFISIWADQPSYSNKEGIISFKGGVPNPGIKTSAGLISTITFRAKAPGVAKISFLDSSQVLLSDGKGTNILKSTANGEYNLVLQPFEGPKISSPTHPSLTMWNRNNNLAFFLEKEEGITDFSYTLDQDPNGIPDNISEGSNNSAIFNNVGNGIWYFHAKAKKNGAWGGVSHYPVHIDALPPAPLKIRIETISLLASPRFFAYFSGEDFFSGIDHYEVSVVDMNDPQALSNPFFIEAASPYQIPFEKTGDFAVLVRAYDKAGNFTQEKAVLKTISPFISYTQEGIKIKNFLLPSWLIYPITIIILAFIGWLIYNYLKRRNLGKRLKTEVAEAEKEIEDVRKLEKKIQDMRLLEEEARRESERLAGRLKEENNDQSVDEKQS